MIVHTIYRYLQIRYSCKCFLNIKTIDSLDEMDRTLCWS